MRSGAHSRALGRLRGEQLEFALDRVDEQIDVTSRAFLGLTVACARCHDQNSDPISQCNYYALAGIFQSTDTLSGGQRAVDGIMDTRDLHATILHLLGLDHEALTYTECGNPARNPAVKLMLVETEREQGVDVEKADRGNSASNSATWRLVSLGAFGPDFSTGRPVSLSLPMRASWARGARRLRMMRPPSMAAFSESPACKPSLRRMGPGRTTCPLLESFRLHGKTLLPVFSRRGRRGWHLSLSPSKCTPPSQTV